MSRFCVRLGAMAVLGWAVSAYAAEETLLPGGLAAGGYGASVFRLTAVDGRLAYLTGGQGAIVFEHTLTVGAAGYGLSAPTIEKTIQGVRTRLGLIYGGALLGITIANNRLWHGGVNTLLGGGIASYSNSESLNSVKANTTFFVAEPQLYAELNVTRWFRIALGAGYRFSAGASMEDFDDGDLRAVIGDLALKFGNF